MKAIRVESYGGPDRLVLQDIEKPTPKSGEALVKIEAIGVNFIDVYHRTGLYPMPLPFTPGSEAAGTVEAAGADADDIQVGGRVAYAMSPGAYAEYASVPVSKLVKLPDNIDAQHAAAAMLQHSFYYITCAFSMMIYFLKIFCKIVYDFFGLRFFYR